MRTEMLITAETDTTAPSLPLIVTRCLQVVVVSSVYAKFSPTVVHPTPVDTNASAARHVPNKNSSKQKRTNLGQFVPTA